MKTKIIYSLPLFLLILSYSCKKDSLVSTIESVPTSKANARAAISSVPIATYPLDWENISTMPTPANTQTILVPWASGASRQITPDIVNDYKKEDGWTLVYNTFNTGIFHDDLYFILYNKYRGLIKMYYYVPGNANFIASTNIVHKLGIEGSYASRSPLMNFAASTIVDFDKNKTTASTIEQWQVARSTWYAFEYEIAYDEGMKNQSFGTCNFIWPINSNQVTSVKINGKIEGTLNGSISVPGLDLTISPSFNSTKIGDGNIIIKGGSDVEKVKPSISAQLFNNLKGLVTKKLTSGVGGIVENVMNGVFGGKSDVPEDNVNLKINADVSLEGSLSSNFLLSAKALSVPGSDQSFTTGFVPAYTSPLGVFYIKNKPVVLETEHRIYPAGGDGPIGFPEFGSSQYVYTVKRNTLNLVFNPAVLEIADIKNVTQEVVLQYTGTGIEAIGRIEDIGESKFFIGSRVGTEGYPAPVVGIRVSFDVVPKNGAKKSKVVKTFAVHVENTIVHNPPGQKEW